MQTQTVLVPKFPSVQKSLHAELKKRVNQYLDEHTIRGTGNYKLFTKAAILISLFFITYIHLVFFTPPTAFCNCGVFIFWRIDCSHWIQYYA